MLELLRWWGNGEYIDNEINEIIVSFDTYIQKRGWFKNNWRLKSRKVYVSEQLKNKIKEINQTRVNFEEALQTKPLFPEDKLEIKNIKRTLTKEQIYNVCSSLSVPSGANFSVPGAGKTTTTLTIWSHLLENNKVNKLLVICPKSAFEAWLETEPKDTFKIAPKTQLFEKDIIRSDIKILVTNYEKLENQENLNNIYTWMLMNKVMMVLDEAHRVKGGGNSIRWQACKKLSNKASRIEILTGTKSFIVSHYSHGNYDDSNSNVTIAGVIGDRLNSFIGGSTAAGGAAGVATSISDGTTDCSSKTITSSNSSAVLPKFGNVTVASNVTTAVVITDPGSGFSVGDTITINDVLGIAV